MDFPLQTHLENEQGKGNSLNCKTNKALETEVKTEGERKQIGSIKRFRVKCFQRTLKNLEIIGIKRRRRKEGEGILLRWKFVVVVDRKVPVIVKYLVENGGKLEMEI
jgi:hypothetical protein